MCTKILNNDGLANASPLRRDAAALATFLVLTLVMTNPLVLYIASAVEDKQDALLNTWIIAWVGHALITDPLNLFNANIFYPYLNTLAFSETMLPQGIFALPFNLAFDNTVLGYNLVLLASFFLSAYAMYLFVFDLTRNRQAGLIAGTIFAFNPYNLGNLAQAQLLSFGWLPLSMMYLRRLLCTKSEKLEATSGKPNLRISFLFAFFFSLQALSSFYYAFLAGIAVILYIGWFFITNRPQRFTFYSTRLTQLAVSAALSAIFVIPFFAPYLQVQRDLGFERKVEESEPFSASLKLYTEVSSQNVLYGGLLAPKQLVFNGGYPLDNLFPGFFPVCLAIIGVAFTKHRDRWFYFILCAFAFLLSLGPRLYIAPNQPIDLTLPYRWLYDLFPFMRALRAPVRFDALVLFAMAVLAGMGLARLQIADRRWQNWRGKFMVAYLLLPLIALEYLALPAAQITPVLVGDAIPEYVKWLRKQPPGVVLELPMIASEPSKPLDLTTQYLTSYHWHQTPDGYSGFNPPRRGEIAYEVQSFPNERSIALLQALDVRYVVIRANQMADWNTQSKAIERVADLQRAQQFGNEYVYHVAPRSVAPAALDVRVYLPQPAAVSQPYVAFLIAQNRGTKPFAIKPTDGLQVDYVWTAPSPQPSPFQGEGESSANLPLVTSSVSVLPIRLSAPTREGKYRLDLGVSNRVVGVWGLSGDVNVTSAEPARQVVIPAGIVLRAPLKPEYMRGDPISVDMTWLPYNKVDAYYSASVRVVNSRGEKIIAQDREPRVSTFLWMPGVQVEEWFTLSLPKEMTPGEYSVQLLMYQAEQGIEALLLDEKFNPQQTISLGKIVVK